jgi:predicted nucleotidyltransferase
MSNSAVLEHKTPQKQELIFNSIVPQETGGFNLEILPDTYKNDIKKAVEILKHEDCKEIYLFGSLITGEYNEYSDIDIGIKGLAPEKFFRTWGLISKNTNNEIDLVDFDGCERMYNILKKCKELFQII